jgi:hypothetical protein
MEFLALLPVARVGDVTAASNSMQSFVVPLLSVLDGIGGLLCVLGIMYSAYLFMTSSGDAGRLQHAKRMLRNAIVGLVIVLAATTGTAILHHAYTSPAPGSGSNLPTISEVQPAKSTGGWSTILIDALDGFFTNIVSSLAKPILNGLAKFTEGTPLMVSQVQIFNMWLVLLGIANVLFTLVVALLGFRVMSAEMFGLGDIELRTMLPQIGLIYLVMNLSIFAIDLIISLSNAIITAIYAGFPGTNIWKALIATAVHASGLPLASLLVFVAFTALALMLLVFYFERLIILSLGAALSPIVILLWLLPGFRDFVNNLVRTYLVVIFVLLVHVVILMIGATFLNSELLGPTGTPNPFADLLVGFAVISTLLATQRFMVQMAIISSGANSARNMGKQFAAGWRYTGDKIDDYAGSQLAEMAPGLRQQYALVTLGSLE